ncbi:MAG: ABC transporter ATP-binding protein [Candidatus Sumerlaeia bacterium]
MSAGTPSSSGVSRPATRRDPASVLLALVFVLLVVIPFLPAGKVQIRLFDTAILVMIYMILSLGLNIVLGWVGLLDLGYVAFILIGVYTTALLYASPLLQFPFGFLVVIAIAGLHCVLWGVIRGVPTLRLAGDYYAIVTFAFAEIVFTIIRNEVWLTGGPQGFRDYPAPQAFWYALRHTDPSTGASEVHNWALGFAEGADKVPAVIGQRAVSPEQVVTTIGWGTAPMSPGGFGFYCLTLVLLAATIFVMVRLYNSRVGRAWLAINADETAARSCGVHVNRYKMLAFGLSAFFGGVAGALMAWRNNIASPNTYDFWLSVIVLCCVVLGGIGSIRGVLMGALILTTLGEALRDALAWTSANFGWQWADQRLRFLFYGVVMIVIMIFRPQGLFPPGPRRERFSTDDIPHLLRRPSRLFSLATQEHTGRRDTSAGDQPTS